MTPHVAELFAPGSMPSVLREKYGDITSPWLFVHREGVRIVTPHTMKPSPGVEQVPSAGVDDSLTWNFGELWSVILYIKKPVVLFTSMSAGFGPLPSISRRAPAICHHE